MIGVVSHGIGNCSSKDFPAKYVNVYKYRDWIRNKTEQIGLFQVFIIFTIVAVDNSWKFNIYQFTICLEKHSATVVLQVECFVHLFCSRLLCDRNNTTGNALTLSYFSGQSNLCGLEFAEVQHAGVTKSCRTLMLLYILSHSLFV